MLSQYKLRSELHLHHSDVRSVASSPDASYLATASRDNTIGLWALNGDMQYVIKKTLRGHGHFVNAVSFLEAGGELLVVSGSADKTLRLWGVGDEEEKDARCVVESHENAVCDVVGWDGGFASASWDGTARSWEVAPSGRAVRCVTIMRGHEAAVWCVMPMSGGGFVTGGADKVLRAWDGHGRCIGIMKGHVDVVRGLCRGPDNGFISVANDSAEVFWKKNPSGFSVDRIVENLHDGSFVYRVASGVVDGVWQVVSAGEDNMVRVVLIDANRKNYKRAQTVPHPGTVWDVDLLANGDILSACSDGIVRLFTRDDTLVANPEALKAYEKLIAARRVSSKLVGGIDVSKLQDADDALATPGTRDGEQRIVRRGNGAEVYLWNMGESKWAKVGDVVDSPNGQARGSVGPGELNGKKYDYLFDVEVGEGGEYKKLGYNRGENPYFAAQRFIDDNELNQDFLDQIAKHIETQVEPEALIPADNALGDPLTGGSRYIPGTGQGNTENRIMDGSPLTEGRYRPGGGGTSPSAIKAQRPAREHIPHRKGFITFGASDQLAKIEAKLLELNEGASPMLNAEEITTLKNILITKLSANESAILSDKECVLVEKMLKWPTSVVFPAIDIARLVVARPSGGSYLFGKGKGAVLEDVLGHMTSEDAKVPVLLMGCRFLCNMFRNRVVASVVRSQCKQIIEGCSKASKSNNRRVREAFASLLINYATLLHDSEAPFSDRQGPLQMAISLVSPTENDEEVLFRLLIAIGTLMVDSRESIVKGVEMGAASAAAYAAPKAPRLQKLALEISTIIAV